MVEQFVETKRPERIIKGKRVGIKVLNQSKSASLAPASANWDWNNIKTRTESNKIGSAIRVLFFIKTYD